MKRVILLLLLLSACVAQPYVQPGIDTSSKTEVVEKVMVQCWDNSTAESVEQCPKKQTITSTPAKVVVEQPEAHVPIAKKLLNEAQSKFTGYAYVLSDRMVIVYGNKLRHLFLQTASLEDRTPITDVFVDMDKKTATAYCNVEREGKMQDDSFDIERSRCKDYLDKPIKVSYEKYLSRGPLDYLADFAELEPRLVEDNVQTISIGGNQKTIQPSLHYDVNGVEYVLRIDKRYKVPIKVERQGEQSVDFRDTFFDVMVLYGKQEKITPDWVEYQPVSEYWKAAASK